MKQLTGMTYSPRLLVTPAVSVIGPLAFVAAGNDTHLTKADNWKLHASARYSILLQSRIILSAETSAYYYYRTRSRKTNSIRVHPVLDEKHGRFRVVCHESRFSKCTPRSRIITPKKTEPDPLEAIWIWNANFMEFGCSIVFASMPRARFSFARNARHIKMSR